MDKEDVVHTYNEVLLSIKMNAIMSFTAMWMDPEIVHPSTVNEVSQTQRTTAWCPLYTESKKKLDKWIYLQNTTASQT